MNSKIQGHLRFQEFKAKMITIVKSVILYVYT